MSKKTKLQHAIDAIISFTKKPEPVIAFLVISLFFGVIFVAKIPPLWGADETTHYARAYQIAQGDFVSDKMAYPWGSTSYGGYIPKSVFNLIWHVNDDITKDPYMTSFGIKKIDDLSSYKEFTDKKLGLATEQYFFPNTAAYSPVAYLPGSIGIFISQLIGLNVGQSIFVARLLGLLFYIGCVVLALRALRPHKIAWLFFVIASLPMMLFEASIICGDTVINGLTILFIALNAKALIEKRLERYEVGLLSAATILMPLVKPTYIFIAAAIVVLPAARFAILKKVPAGVVKYGILAVSVIGLAIWTYIIRDVSRAFRLIGTGERWQLISVHDQTAFLLHHPLSFIKTLGRTVLLNDNNWMSGFFGQFGFSYIQIPAVAIIAMIIALLLGFGIANKIWVTKKQALILASLLVIGLISIFGAFYLTFSNVGEAVVEGVQGRYFLPFLPLLALILALLLPGKKSIIATVSGKFTIHHMIICLVLFGITLSVIKYFYVLLG